MRTIKSDKLACSQVHMTSVHLPNHHNTSLLSTKPFKCSEKKFPKDSEVSIVSQPCPLGHAATREKCNKDKVTGSIPGMAAGLPPQQTVTLIAAICQRGTRPWSPGDKGDMVWLSRHRIHDSWNNQSPQVAA